MDDLNGFFAVLRFPMTHAFTSISITGSVFYAVESCSTFIGRSIANAAKMCQANVYFFIISCTERSQHWQGHMLKLYDEVL
jgi:hypothetical protein